MHTHTHSQADTPHILKTSQTPPKKQGKGKLIQEVIAACPSLQRPYCPPVWCLSPWAQVRQKTTQKRAHDVH